MSWPIFTNENKCPAPCTFARSICSQLSVPLLGLTTMAYIISVFLSFHFLLGEKKKKK